MLNAAQQLWYETFFDAGAPPVNVVMTAVLSSAMIAGYPCMGRRPTITVEVQRVALKELNTQCLAPKLNTFITQLLPVGDNATSSEPVL